MDTKSRIRDTRLETRIPNPESHNQTIYTEDILDLYKYPTNKKRKESADITYHDENPSCGDDITIYITLDNTKQKIQEITWTGKGCVISQASAEIISQTYRGKKIKEIQNITPENIKKMLKTKEMGPVRIKCAMLAPATIKKGIIKWERDNGSQFTVNSARGTQHE